VGSLVAPTRWFRRRARGARRAVLCYRGVRMSGSRWIRDGARRAPDLGTARPLPCVPAYPCPGRSGRESSDGLTRHPRRSQVPADPAEAIALFRYRVVAEATNERLSSAERGLVVREREERRAEGRGARCPSCGRQGPRSGVRHGQDASFPASRDRSAGLTGPVRRPHGTGPPASRDRPKGTAEASHGDRGARPPAAEARGPVVSPARSSRRGTRPLVSAT